MQGEVPASETFDLSEVMRGGTAGKALWSTYFKAWQVVPQSILKNLVAETRKRKGLNPEPPNSDEFIDKE
jgi:elongation factor 2